MTQDKDNALLPMVKYTRTPAAKVDVDRLGEFIRDRCLDFSDRVELTIDQGAYIARAILSRNLLSAPVMPDVTDQMVDAGLASMNKSGCGCLDCEREYMKAAFLAMIAALSAPVVPDGWRLTEKQQIVWDWAASHGLTLLADDCNDLLWKLLIIESKPVVMAAYPIDSAPHDGTPIIAMLFGDDGIMRWASKARYGRDRGDKNSHWYDGMNERLIQPTHFIPTPKVKP